MNVCEMHKTSDLDAKKQAIKAIYGNLTAT